jgi:WbqC-like protein family
MKIVTGHQPVYLPWLGLFHKASLADVFVFMDDVRYLRQDWNNRNQVKTSAGKAKWLTVPVSLNNSSSELLKDILIAPESCPIHKRWQVVHWATLQACYGRARYFREYAPFFEWTYLEKKWERLSELNLAILRQGFEWFGIDCEVVIGSTERFEKRKSDLVLEHALRYDADVVITGSLGKDYIQEEEFHSRGIKVFYQDYRHPLYEQRFGEFIPRLSFVDLLFNHGTASREIYKTGNWTREDLCQMVSS